MVQKQDKTTALPGVLATISAGFELTTRFLWLMLLPALLDLFLWIGPRLSFRTLIESTLETSLALLPTDMMTIDPQLLLETAGRLNHFAYLSVSLLGVPTLMREIPPQTTPLTPAVIEGGGALAWFGYLLLFTVLGLLLTALYYNLIAYAMRRATADRGRQTTDDGPRTTRTPGTEAGSPPSGDDRSSDDRSRLVSGRLTPARFARRTLQTWLRLMALALLFIVLVMVIAIPVTLLAGFAAILSQLIATFILFGAIVLVIWLLMFLSYTPQGMLLNPRPFLIAVGDSVRLFQGNMPASLGLIFLVLVLRQVLSFVLLTADSGTWVTAILILAHAYIVTALTVALFLFYRDRFVAYLKTAQTPVKA